MSRSTLVRRTELHAPVREVITLEESHAAFLADLIEEIQQRTGRRIDRSQIIRALIDAVLNAGMTAEDIDAAERRRLKPSQLAATREEILAEIERNAEGLRRALVEFDTENIVTREYRRTLRYQRARLKAVDELLEAALPSDPVLSVLPPVSQIDKE
jgi:nitrogen fixation/metabolism regulation signal transduction histidine kinase